MKIRSLLIDSNYLLKRSINAARDTYTNSFGHIGGLYMFMTVVRKFIKEHKINKTLLFWDGENSGVYRHHIDLNYKANRTSKEWYNKIEMTDAQIKREQEKEESILKQRKRIQAYAEELFLRQIEVDKIEADDLIAEYCMRNHDKEEIFLHTNDRDFSQLLDYGITILFGNINTPINKFNYMMYFKHYYRNALTIKIITGDNSDNIEGIKGIKENVLLKHIPELGFRELKVKDVCNKAKIINENRIKEKKKPLKIFENLLNNFDRLKLNHRLMNLSEPILNDEAYEELEQLELPLSPEGRSSKNLYNMMREDGFLDVYGGTFVNYVEPFYVVIMCEKESYNKYIKNN